LDLKGGMRVILEVDRANVDKNTQVDAAMAASIRGILNDRVNAFGLTGATVASKGIEQFVVEIPATAPRLASDLASDKIDVQLQPGENIIGTGPDARIKLTDKKVPARIATITFEGGDLRLKADAAGVQYDGKDVPVGQTRDLENGYVLKFGDTSLRIHIPPGSTETLKQLTRTAQLTFHWFRDVKWANDSTPKNPNAKYTITQGVHPTDPKRDYYTFTESATGKPVDAKTVIADSPKIVTGADLLPKSKQGMNPQNAEILVEFEFNRAGTAAFADFTRNHVGDILAIILDNEVISAPRINDPILLGQGTISGGFKTVLEARTLAQLLNAGALPVPLKPAQTQVVGATLGQDSVERSIQAGLWGLLLCVGFVVLYYILPGALAAVALLFYAILTFAIYKGLGVVLDLPGITGFILSVGMAVDANILIFERLKEEMKSGKTLHAAIDTAFNRAFTSIFDSNVTTWIVCAILYWLGTNLIKGFALTLAIGVAVSMFTAITVSRTMLHLVVNVPSLRKPGLFGLDRTLLSRRSGEGGWLQIFAHRRVFFTLSIALMAISLLCLGVGRIRPGIDFTGGSVLQVAFQQAPDLAQVRAAVEKAGVEDAQVQTATDARLGNTVLIRSAALPQEKLDAIRTELSGLGGNLLQTETIGPTIAKEVTTNAFLSVLVSFLFIAGYLAVRFAIGGIANGVKYGVCALLGIVHNVVAVTGLFALGGWLWGWQVDSLFITALLTVIGYSVHDTIVVYDRLRENLRNRGRGEDLIDIANRSITQTFDRSINTGVTVLLVLLTLIIFGGASIKLFNVALLAGIIVGTYSSIFVATPLVIVWERLTSKAAPAAVGGKRPAAPGDVRLQSSQSSRQTVSAGSGSRTNGSGTATVERPISQDGDDPGIARSGGSTIKPKRKRRM
jgi:SecD/SecF fusion protein